MKRLWALFLMLPASAHADGLAVALTAGSIPASTVAVIDPEIGSSTGGGTTDLRLTAGDFVSIRFRYTPVPANSYRALVGLQAYLTVYLPNNTQVVGARLLSSDQSRAVTVPARPPGISVDASAGSSMSQLSADTGLFLTSDDRLVRSPLDAPLARGNGIAITSPVQAGAIAEALGESPTPPFHAHNPWDAAMAEAFGGGGLPPVNRGSPVAGDGAFYTAEGSGAVGPWSRLRYDGALIGFDPAGATAVRRAVSDASTLGFDLTPQSAIDVAGTRAVRFALGDVRPGLPGVAEVTLLVLGTPLDAGPGTVNSDLVCAEVFVGDDAKRGPAVIGPGGEDNPWATFVPVARCVPLNLGFDLRVDRPLALGGDSVKLELERRNLSQQTQTGVDVFIAYDSRLGTATGATPEPTYLAGACPPVLNSDWTCARWNVGDVFPAKAARHTLSWVVHSGGEPTHRFQAVYRSDQVSEGFVTEERLLVAPTPVLAATSALGVPSVAPGESMPVTVTFTNTGTESATLHQIGIFAPAGFVLQNLNLDGGAIECAGPFVTEAVCPVSASLAPHGGKKSLTFVVSAPVGTATALYPLDVDLWASTPVYPGQGENLFPRVATIPVGAPRSAPPVVTCGILPTATAISGAAAADSTIRVAFNRLPRGTTTADQDGGWSFTGFPATFGPLYGGIDVVATAQATGELESEPSAPCVVLHAGIFKDGFEHGDTGGWSSTGGG